MDKEKIKVVVIRSAFNFEIVDNLYKGVEKSFNDKKLSHKMKVIEVPGAFEIPYMANRVLDSKYSDFDKPDCIITLGCVIKGETAHFEYISKTVTDQIMNLSIHNNQNIPVIYGVLTTLDYQQALARTKQDKSNKGYEVMDSAIYMINQFSSLNK